MADNKQQQQLQIELKPEIAQGVYSNMVLLTHSSNEVILDFVSMMPGMPKANVASRVVMVPEHAKRLLYALQDNIAKYEAQFGKIDLNQQPANGPRTIAPFEINKGEA